MSLRSRSLATLMAVPLLMASLGCRHKTAHSPSSATQPLETETAQKGPAPQPPSAEDPIVPLRPHLAEVISKVADLAKPMGLAGWPGVQTTDETWDEKNATAEQRIFYNDRALIFYNQAKGTYLALVLMPTPDTTWTEGYRPIWVCDLFGNPILKAAHFESIHEDRFGSGDFLSWVGSDSVARGVHADPHRPRLFSEEPTLICEGQKDSDAEPLFLALATPSILDCLEGIYGANGMIEGYPPETDPDMVAVISHEDFQSAVKKGESKRFLWFDVKGKMYAADKLDWDMWLKRSQSAPPSSAP